MSLHDELQRLADAAPRPSIDHTVWDRGRALRRRDRLVTSAVVLALVVIMGGLAALVIGAPRVVAPASDTVPEGAIPSHVEYVSNDSDLPLEADLAVGRASVSFISGGGFAVVIGATDGRYHRLDLPGVDSDLFLPPALSPDGTRLAWSDTQASVVRLVDLETGELSQLDITGTTPGGVRWTPDGGTLLVSGTSIGSGTKRAARIDLATGDVTRVRATFANTTGYPSPDGSLLSVVGDQETHAAFVSPDKHRTLERVFPTDVYPDGVAIQPLGWPDDHLVLASAESATPGEVGGRDLILFTSPDLPESEWTFRIVERDLPHVSLSVAVDLIPDLDGTSSQQLTHDFGEPDWPGQRDISWLIGLGVAGALSVLYGLRWLWRRRTAL